MKQSKGKSVLIASLIVLVVLTGLPFPLLIKLVIDTVSYGESLPNLWQISLIFLLLVFAQLLLNLILSITSSKWSQSIAYDLRSRIYSTKLNAQNNQLSQNQDTTQTAIVSDCEIIGSNFQNIYITVISSIICIVSYLLLLTFLNVYLSFVIILAIPLFTLLNLKLSGISKEYFSKIQKSKDSLLAHLLDTAQGFLFIYLYNLRPAYTKSFNAKNDELTKTSIYFNTMITFISSLVNFLAVTAPFLVFLIGGFLITSGKSTVGNIIACYSYASAIFVPVSRLINLLPSAKQLSLSCERVNHILANKNNADKSHIHKVHLPKDVTLDVDHLYVSDYKNNKIISSMVYVFVKNRVYLVKGPNASGKSTFARAVVGIAPIRSGSISINKDCKILYVPEIAYLFKDSILNNLTLGITHYDSEYLAKLIHITSLDNDLEKNNMTLASQVDNDQQSLSTGQIQKIKLIHALLSRPSILIIDEIFANMDEVSQKKILTYLGQWVHGGTLIIISHEHSEISKVLDPTEILFPQRMVS